MSQNNVIVTFHGLLGVGMGMGFGLEFVHVCMLAYMHAGVCKRGSVWVFDCGCGCWVLDCVG